MLIFWTFAFPIILGTLFNMAFSNIEKSEKLEIMNIAIVETEEFKENEIFKKSFETLSDEQNEERMFSTKYVTEKEAKKLLENEEIIGYLILTDKAKIVVQQNGINETIFKYVVDEISQSQEIMQTVAKKKIEEIIKNTPPEELGNMNSTYASIYGEVMKMTTENEIDLKNISNSNLSYTMIEFYTLIAMFCLYGGIIGMTAINQTLANMSSSGKRIAVSPTPKGKIILSSVIASYIIQLIGLALLFAYTIFVLKVDYGNSITQIIELSLVGSLAGLTLGIAIGSLLKTNENTKTGIIIAVTMFGCFLSGMMGITMKYIIDKNIPILNKLNPASMITDGFYSLYYYDTFDRFYLNVISLGIFALLMIGISIISLRRQKYDSI